MKIFVCIKQVPDTETKIKIGADGQLDSTGIKWVMNPYDEYAVEEAIKTKEKNPGAQVWALSLGPKARVAEALRTALAMGADESILIDAPVNLDSISTAQALAKVISAEGGGKLVFTGKLAIDDNAASVGQMLAEFLSAPHASVATKFSLEGDSALVERESDGGTTEVIQLTTPAVITANKGLNMPRYASLPGIMKAKKKTIKEFSLDSLGVTSAAKVTYSNLSLPAEKPPVKMLSGDVATQVSSLVQHLRNEAKVL